MIQWVSSRSPGKRQRDGRRRVNIALPRRRRNAIVRKPRLKHRAVTGSLQATASLLSADLPPSQSKSARTTNAIERLHEEFKLQIKTQAGLPSAENYAVLGLTCLGTPLCRSSLTSR